MKSMIILAMSIVFMSCSTTNHPAKKQLVQEVMKVTGLKEQFSSLEGALDQQIAMLQANKEGKSLSPGQLIAQKNFNQEELIQSLEESITKQMKTEELQEIKTLYEDPMMKKITKIEEEKTADPDFMSHLQQFAVSSEVKKVTPQRIQIINQLDLATQGTEQLVNMQKSMLKNLFKAIGQGSGAKNQKEVNWEKLEESWDNSMTPIMKQYSMLTALYTYQDLSDEDISNYASLYQNNKALEKLGKTSFIGLNSYFKKWSEKTGKEVGIFYKNLIDSKKTE